MQDATEGVKGQDGRSARSYDSAGRREKARATRRRVVIAATQLLEERGFVATTIASVAERAGVSPESVYKTFGTKARLIKAAFDDAIAGDDEPVPVAERPETQRIIAEPTIRGKLRLYAEGAAARSERTARIQLALRDAAASDSTTAELWRDVQSERLIGTTGFARHLLGTGLLRDGIAVEEVRDVLWATVSAEMYDLLVRQRDWTPEAYARWLTRAWVASFLEDAD